MTTYFRTLLEDRGVRSAVDFLHLYRTVARDLSGGPYEEPAEKTVEGWIYAGRRPNSAFRPVIVAMLGHPIPTLWSTTPQPPSASLSLAASPTTPHAAVGGVGISEMRRTGSMAVRRARKFLMDSDQQRIGDTSIALLEDEVERLVRDYPRVPLSSIWGDLLDAHDQALHLIETGRFAPRQLRQVNAFAAILSFMVAKGFHDMEDRSQARTMALVAGAFARDAEHPGLTALVYGLQSLVEYWADRPADASFYAQKGTAAASGLRGTVQPWLLGLQARASAVLGDAETAHAAVREAADLREHVVLDDLDKLGGLLIYSEPKQLYYEVEAQAILADTGVDLAARAEEAVDRFSDPAETNWAFGDLAGARCNLALVRLAAGDIDGSAEAMRPVLDLTSPYRTNGVVASATRVRLAIVRAPSRAAAVARNLTEEIAVFPPQRLALNPAAGH
ncbi:hypothetical protein [Streptomyces sp. NPDC054784]